MCIPDWAGKSTGVRLRTELIGVSPLPGTPPAAYGSIIVPESFHRLIRSKRIFQIGSESLTTLLSVITLSGRWFMAHHHSAEVSLRSGLYLLKWVFNFQGSLVGITPHLSTARFWSKNETSKLKKIKNFLMPPKRKKAHQHTPVGMRAEKKTHDISIVSLSVIFSYLRGIAEIYTFIPDEMENKW